MCVSVKLHFAFLQQIEVLIQEPFYVGSREYHLVSARCRANRAPYTVCYEIIFTDITSGCMTFRISASHIDSKTPSILIRILHKRMHEKIQYYLNVIKRHKIFNIEQR